MAYKIVWTKNAGEDLKEIVEYLKKDWPLEVSENFISELFLKLDLISKFPFAGVESLKEKNVRKILITKHNALYYRVEEDRIRSLDFFDTRRDTEKDIYN